MRLINNLEKNMIDFEDSKECNYEIEDENKIYIDNRDYEKEMILEI